MTMPMIAPVSVVFELLPVFAAGPVVEAPAVELVAVIVAIVVVAEAKLAGLSDAFQLICIMGAYSVKEPVTSALGIVSCPNPPLVPLSHVTVGITAEVGTDIQVCA